MLVDEEYVKAALKFLEHKDTTYVFLTAILGSKEGMSLLIKYAKG